MARKIFSSRIMFCLLAFVLCLITPAWAGSDLKFPAYKSWKLVKDYVFPCDDLETVPRVFQTLGAALCPLLSVDSHIYIYARPEALDALEKGKEYPDGPNFAYVITKVKGIGTVVLIKGHDLGEPIYGIFSTNGEDLEGSSKLLSKKTCISCHNVYCKPAGVCLKQPWNRDWNH